MATIRLRFRPSTVKDHEGSLFFQITHRRQVRKIHTGLHLRNDEWDTKRFSVILPIAAEVSRMKYLDAVRSSIREQQTRIESIIIQLEKNGSIYTAHDVVTAFNHSPIAAAGLVSFTRTLIKDMRKIGKNSTARRYTVSLNSLLRYIHDNEVEWHDITSTFMLGYEEFLTKRGLCRNSTSYYMRNLRSIINRAVDQGFAIPFNPFRYVYTGIDKTVKRAVSLDTIRTIRNLNLSDAPELDFARNIFMFAFYTRGMSFIDIAFLKKRDIQNGVIVYSRRKTRQQLLVRIEPETRRIINSFGRNNTPYLFPIINDKNGNPERQYANAYSRVNRNIQKVGKMLGLRSKLTLYVARHTWASIAHENNVDTATISQALGHDSEKTTIIYLRSLDMASVDKANSDIIRMTAP